MGQTVLCFRLSKEKEQAVGIVCRKLGIRELDVFCRRDERGVMQTHPERFPNGLKGVADHIH